MQNGNTLEVIHDGPAAATWTEAKHLLSRVRSGARAWIELGGVLEALRTEFFAHERGGGAREGAGRKSDWEKANCKNNQTPHRAAFDSAAEKGWQAKVREELGISDDTARRWIEDGRRFRQMLQIQAGAIEQIDGRLITDQVRERAAEALAEIEGDPTVRPARAWAGLWGAAATKGMQRKPTDHSRNIRRGLIALATSLEHWDDLPAKDRVLFETAWAQIVAGGLIPSTWRRL